MKYKFRLLPGRHEMYFTISRDEEIRKAVRQYRISFPEYELNITGVFCSQFGSEPESYEAYKQYRETFILDAINMMKEGAK